MTELLKYLRGYVRVKVSGFSPERFMNLCGNRDILLWNVKKEGEIYYMCLSLRNFYKLSPIVRKTRTKVVIVDRCGLPFLLPFLYQRKVFVLGLLFTLAFWMISSLYIWDIEFAGNYQITNDSLAIFLEHNNIKPGMRKSLLDIETMEKEIRKTFPQITWTSAKMAGTKLLIEIKENDAPIIFETTEQEEGRDLVAEYDGIIKEMIVRKGVPKVAIGEEITKGTVLVEGSVPIYNDDTTVREYRYVDADADILLEHRISHRIDLPFAYEKKKYTGREKESYFLRIDEWEWRQGKEPDFLLYDSVIRENRPLLFDKLSIPIYTGTYQYREYQNWEHEYTLEEAESILHEKLNTFIVSLDEKGVQIIEKNVKIDTDSNAWYIQGEFLVQELVGIDVKISEQDRGETGADE